MGPPSSGKSTIIESILGFEFLPKGESSLATRRPIEIKLEHSPDQNAHTYAEIKTDSLSGQKFQNMSDVKSKLSEILNKVPNDTIETDPIKISIYGYSNPDITIIDLPGGGSNIKNSKDLIFSYAKSDSCVLVYVQDTNHDDFVNAYSIDSGSGECVINSNSNIFFDTIKEVDSDFKRTVSVLTKVDLLDTNRQGPSGDKINLVKKLINSSGSSINSLPECIIVKNRTPSDHGTIEDFLYKEKSYFNTHNIFRTVASSENSTLDTVFDRIKVLLYKDSRFKKNVQIMYKSLKESSDNCQIEITKFGTDYINYTNDTKNTYATTLINSFCESVEKLFSGKMSDTNEELSSHKLKQTYYDFLGQYKVGYRPSDKIDNKEIIRKIKITEGDQLSGFPESEVIYSLLEDEMEKLRDYVKAYVTTVEDITRSSIKETLLRVFCRFPKLMNKVEEVVTGFIDEVWLVFRIFLEILFEFF